MKKKRNLLIVAFHFPPLQGSSGLHRTLSWARNLPRDGWEVTVLTASRGAYQRVLDENESLIPKDTRVIRAPAFDAIQKFSIKGRYPGFLALPDRFQSWIIFASAIGLFHCLRNRPDLILSTYPIASAHYIGRVLSKLSGIPWIADFRDPMAQSNYPRDSQRRQSLHKLEKHCASHATRIFVTTPGTKRLFMDRYPDVPPDHFCIVQNGYNESFFDTAQPSIHKPNPDKTVLLHSGGLYRYERDPSCLFEALAQLRDQGHPQLDDLEIRFRGAANAEYFQDLAKRYEVSGLVSFVDAVPYQEAVVEMLDADALLLLQASNCNDQIPAKIYEYIRAGRPILALTDPIGDTAQLLASVSINAVARLDDTESIKNLLVRFFEAHPELKTTAHDDDIERFSRKSIAMQVAEILNGICS